MWWCSQWYMNTLEFDPWRSSKAKERWRKTKREGASSIHQHWRSCFFFFFFSQLHFKLSNIKQIFKMCGNLRQHIFWLQTFIQNITYKSYLSFVCDKNNCPSRQLITVAMATMGCWQLWTHFGRHWIEEIINRSVVSIWPQNRLQEVWCVA